MSLSQINKKIKEVPPYLLPEIIDYIDFLIAKYVPAQKEKKAFSFKWESGLKELSNKYNSVELQHKVNDWR